MAEGALAVSERVNYDVLAASGNTGRLVIFRLEQQ
jgi:hypothetical protein